ncbi:MAG: exosome complex RNA-binding protein Rrp4 [Nanoarchaeota archaeon]
MGELKVKDKDIIIPGEVLAVGMDFLPANGTFREEDKIIASEIGIVNVSGRLIKLVPLTGRYIPKKGDAVIGKVVDIGLNGWRVDIRWAYEANLGLKEASPDFIDSRKTNLADYYNFGDIIMAQISFVTGSKIVDLSMRGPGLRKLIGGRIIEIIPSKVPRVIGKQGSMISMIKEKTDCRILVGQNGRVWISGADPKKELIAAKTIKKIDEESTVDGLTDTIKDFLEKECK